MAVLPIGFGERIHPCPQRRQVLFANRLPLASKLRLVSSPPAHLQSAQAMSGSIRRLQALSGRRKDEQNLRMRFASNSGLVSQSCTMAQATHREHSETTFLWTQTGKLRLRRTIKFTKQRMWMWSVGRRQVRVLMSQSSSDAYLEP